MSSDNFDEKVITDLKQKSPEMFGYSAKNDISNGYVYINDERLEFKRYGIVEALFTMIMPLGFKRMPESTAKLKYLSADKPDYIYSNDDTTFTVAFSKDTQNEAVDLTELRDSIKDLLVKLNSNNKILFCDDTPKNKTPYFSFESETLDDTICTFMFFLGFQDGMLMGTITRPNEEIEQWNDVVLQMIDSIEFA